MHYDVAGYRKVQKNKKAQLFIHRQNEKGSDHFYPYQPFPFLLINKIYQNSNSRNCHQIQWNFKITTLNMEIGYK